MSIIHNLLKGEGRYGMWYQDGEASLKRWSNKEQEECFNRIKNRCKEESFYDGESHYIPIKILLEELPEWHPTVVSIKKQMEVEDEETI